MSKPIRSLHPHLIRTQAGDVLIADCNPNPGDMWLEVSNRTFDTRSFVAITPEQAREIAAELVRRADLADGGQS